MHWVAGAERSDTDPLPSPNVRTKRVCPFIVCFNMKEFCSVYTVSEKRTFLSATGEE